MKNYFKNDFKKDTENFLFAFIIMSTLFALAFEIYNFLNIK